MAQLWTHIKPELEGNRLQRANFAVASWVLFFSNQTSLLGEFLSRSSPSGPCLKVSLQIPQDHAEFRVYKWRDWRASVSSWLCRTTYALLRAFSQLQNSWNSSIVTPTKIGTVGKLGVAVGNAQFCLQSRFRCLRDWLLGDALVWPLRLAGIYLFVYFRCSPTAQGSSRVMHRIHTCKAYKDNV